MDGDIRVGARLMPRLCKPLFCRQVLMFCRQINVYLAANVGHNGGKTRLYTATGGASTAAYPPRREDIMEKAHAGAHKYRRVEEFSGVVVLAMPGKVELGLARGREKTARWIFELPVDGSMSPSVTSRRIFQNYIAIHARGVLHFTT